MDVLTVSETFMLGRCKIACTMLVYAWVKTMISGRQTHLNQIEGHHPGTNYCFSKAAHSFNMFKKQKYNLNVVVSTLDNFPNDMHAKNCI